GVGVDFVAEDSPRWPTLRGEGRAGEYGRHGTAPASTLQPDACRPLPAGKPRRDAKERREWWWWWFLVSAV
ncbi:hypothetical protein C8Q77DRAFT_1121198, partial [Trametes polyzona]